MNAPRKKQVVALPDSHEFSGWTGSIKKHLNTALTVLLVIASVVLFVQWRMRTREAARLSVATELANARQQVKDLQQFRLPIGRASTEILSALQSIQNAANGSISDVLNNSDATTKMRAQALNLRGDLYWDLANLPPLPGSTTQPTLALSDSSDALLQKASDSYEEVIKNSTYADQHEELAGAHLGLAAIAENRGDWAAAKTELETVQNDPNALGALVDLAKIQLAEIPAIQNKMYIAPPTGIGPIALSPMGPVSPAAPVGPAMPAPAATQPFKP
jgi:hypothetical protein